MNIREFILTGNDIAPDHKETIVYSIALSLSEIPKYTDQAYKVSMVQNGPDDFQYDKDVFDECLRGFAEDILDKTGIKFVVEI